MNDFLVSALKKAARRKKGLLVFHALEQDNGRPMSVTHIRRSLRAATEKAGIPPVRIHDLRHTFGTILAENGNDPKTIMELMGHSSVEMVMVYVHTSETKKRDAIEGLGLDGIVTKE